MTKPGKKSANPSAAQVDRFRETARQLECDEDQERFEEKLGKIATARQPPSAKASPKAARRDR